jgi:hypothetical protein
MGFGSPAFVLRPGHDGFLWEPAAPPAVQAPMTSTLARRLAQEPENLGYGRSGRGLSKRPDLDPSARCLIGLYLPIRRPALVHFTRPLTQKLVAQRESTSPWTLVLITQLCTCYGEGRRIVMGPG